MMRAFLVGLCLIAAMLVSVPSTSFAQSWTFSTNTPASNGSITRFGSTVGYGNAPNAGDIADYQFEQQDNYPVGNWNIRNSAQVTAITVPGGMGMVVWSQTLQGPVVNNIPTWPVSAPDGMMPPGRLPDYRARLFKQNVVDITYNSIKVTF